MGLNNVKNATNSFKWNVINSLPFSFFVNYLSTYHFTSGIYDRKRGMILWKEISDISEDVRNQLIA